MEEEHHQILFSSRAECQENQFHSTIRRQMDNTGYTQDRMRSLFRDLTLSNIIRSGSGPMTETRAVSCVLVEEGKMGSVCSMHWENRLYVGQRA
jgi:hypothetical protein